ATATLMEMYPTSVAYRIQLKCGHSSFASPQSRIPKSNPTAASCQRSENGVQMEMGIDRPNTIDTCATTRTQNRQIAFMGSRDCRRGHRRCERIAGQVNVPSSAEEGWPRHQEKTAKPPYWSGRGGVGQENWIELDQHHPVYANFGSFAAFLDRA